MQNITLKTAGPWRLYWTSPLANGAKALGTVTRDGYDTGALIVTAKGIYVQGNAGSYRSLPQSVIAVGLHMATVGAEGGKARGAAKTSAARSNGLLGGRPARPK
jgi:hypothetical protein